MTFQYFILVFASIPAAAQSTADIQTPASDCRVRRAPNVSADQALARGRQAAANRQFGEAMSWFCVAENQGSIRATTNIGALYRDGLGVPADPARAMDRFNRAANGGDTLAMFNIGYMLDHGIGRPINHAEGLTWFKRAALLGEPRAKPYLVCYNEAVNNAMISLIRAARSDPQLRFVGVMSIVMNLQEVDENYHVEMIDVPNSGSAAQYNCTATIRARRTVKSVLPNDRGEQEVYVPGTAGSIIPLIQTFEVRSTVMGADVDQYAVSLTSIGELGGTRIAISRPYSVPVSVPHL